MTRSKEGLSKKHWMMLAYLAVIIIATAGYIVSIASKRETPLTNHAAERLNFGAFSNWKEVDDNWPSFVCSDEECGGLQWVYFISWSKNKLAQNADEGEKPATIKEGIDYLVHLLENPTNESIFSEKWKRLSPTRETSVGSFVGYETKMIISPPVTASSEEKLFKYGVLLVSEDEDYINLAVGRATDNKGIENLKTPSMVALGTSKLKD